MAEEVILIHFEAMSELTASRGIVLHRRAAQGRGFNRRDGGNGSFGGLYKDETYGTRFAWVEQHEWTDRRGVVTPII